MTNEGQLPPDVQDPATLHTPAGALARYRGALDSLPATLDWYVTGTGILTDELADLPTPINVVGPYANIDARTLALAGKDFEADYNRLHRLRAQAREARGFLAAYAPDSSPALQGHLYAVEGFADILLADLFCSGIPLSTIDFNGDYTLQPGSPRDTVYQRAVGLFDSALTLLSDSARLQSLAAIGRGRALLALGRYGEAAAAVASVSDGYQYPLVYNYQPANQGARLISGILGVGTATGGYQTVGGMPSMGSYEGGNGLGYLAAARATPPDPRVLADSIGVDIYGYPLWWPRKGAANPLSGTVTLPLASGIEARLIEAEALLQVNPDDGQWLDKLNALRQAVGLADTTDPGTSAGRVDLLFRERAFWLYFTGHRQGDLRRLVRQYQRSPNEVYPVGGNSVVAPVPETERQRNSKYTGCVNLDA